MPQPARGASLAVIMAWASGETAGLLPFSTGMYLWPPDFVPDLLPGNIPQGGRRELRPADRQRREQCQAAGSAGGDCGQSAAGCSRAMPGLALAPCFARQAILSLGQDENLAAADGAGLMLRLSLSGPWLYTAGKPARSAKTAQAGEGSGLGQGPADCAAGRERARTSSLAQRESIDSAPRGPPPLGQAMVLRRPATCRKRPLRRGLAMLSPLVLLWSWGSGAAPDCLPLLHRWRESAAACAISLAARSVLASPVSRQGRAESIQTWRARPGPNISGSSSQPGRSGGGCETPGTGRPPARTSPVAV